MSRVRKRVLHYTARGCYGDKPDGINNVSPTTSTRTRNAALRAEKKPQTAVTISACAAPVASFRQGKLCVLYPPADCMVNEQVARTAFAVEAWASRCRRVPYAVEADFRPTKCILTASYTCSGAWLRPSLTT